MKIIKKMLLGVGTVDVFATVVAASEFDWCIGLIRENPVVPFNAILNGVIIASSSAFIGVLLVIAARNFWAGIGDTSNWSVCVNIEIPKETMP